MNNVLKSTAIAALLLSTSLFAGDEEFDWAAYSTTTVDTGSSHVEEDEFDWAAYAPKAETPKPVDLTATHFKHEEAIAKTDQDAMITHLGARVIVNDKPTITAAMLTQLNHAERIAGMTEDEITAVNTALVKRSDFDTAVHVVTAERDEAAGKLKTANAQLDFARKFAPIITKAMSDRLMAELVAGIDTSHGLDPAVIHAALIGPDVEAARTALASFDATHEKDGGIAKVTAAYKAFTQAVSAGLAIRK